MSRKIQWFNSIYNPPLEGYYDVQIGKWPDLKPDRAYWDGRAWRRNHNTNQQFIRVHNVASWLMRIENL